MSLGDATHRTIRESYQSQVKRKLLLMGLFFAVILIIAFFSLTHGAYRLSIAQIFNVLTGAPDGTASIVIANIRLPRILSAVFSGWGLSLSGLAIQSILRNPLGSSSTLGISQGAAFGASFSIIFMAKGLFWITASAFVSAMSATAVILMLARLRRLTPEAIILAGVALSSIFASATVLMQYLASDTQLAMVVFWTFGDVARSSWTEILLVSAAVVSVSGYFMAVRWDLNALAFGEETAKSLGVDVVRLRITGMMAAALVASLVTAFNGVIAFLGLVAPHMARRLVGEEHGLLIPFSSVLGALLLLSADTVGRVLIGSGAMPVGVITSFLGGPMFLYLLMRGYR